MTPTQLFQNRHGARWAAIAQGPELTDALLTVNATLFDEIVRMTPEQIAMNGAVTLAKLQGQLLHEQALIRLSIVPLVPEDLSDLATYPSPEEEQAELEREDKRDVETSGATPFQEYQIEQAVKPKRKRKTK